MGGGKLFNLNLRSEESFDMKITSCQTIDFLIFMDRYFEGCFLCGQKSEVSQYARLSICL